MSSSNINVNLYFQLASIAHQLDAEEKSRMAEGTAEEYSTFLNAPSENMDDSGFFSVQVIMRALEVYGLSCKHWNHPALSAARKHPAQNFTAFICNLNQHWFTIRKLGTQWFNIDSCKSGPTLISDTYLEVYLKQIELEGYTVFVVLGSLPECVADSVLLANPLDPSLYKNTAPKKKSSEPPPPPPLPPVATESVEEIRRKRLARFCNDQSETSTQSLGPSAASSSTNEDQDDDLQRAIQLSLM